MFFWEGDQGEGNAAEIELVGAWVHSRRGKEALECSEGLGCGGTEVDHSVGWGRVGGAWFLGIGAGPNAYVVNEGFIVSELGGERGGSGLDAEESFECYVVQLSENEFSGVSVEGMVEPRLVDAD